MSWRSKKQTCVATSSCEAEYIAVCLSTKESVWISRLIADIMQVGEPTPVTIRVDNNGTVDTGYNSSINQRNKHIEVQYH